MLRYPLGFKKPETYLRFYIYTCPIYFIAFTCLGKYVIKIYIESWSNSISLYLLGLENVISVLPVSIPNQYIIQNQDAHDFIGAPQILCAQFNLSLIDTNAINKQGSVENPNKKRWYIIKYVLWDHQNLLWGVKWNINLKKISYSRFLTN